MEFVQGKEGYCEDQEDMIGDKGKLPFSSSSSSSSPSYSQYNGFVPQPNGRWRAQIYEKHQRMWSGTSEYEQGPARSYDQDSFRFGGQDTNFRHKIDVMNLQSPPSINDAAQRREDEEAAGDHGSGGGAHDEYIEREHMFDKVVTPSDVGKLNRLVIPKQHAEKYFPLDSSTNEKGLLLNFEDRGGKSWRFRYSYWNSSQSYVMTKGWSRFVKEKKLDAGDIISFERGVGESSKDRLYIDWRRRPDVPDPSLLQPRQLPFPARSLPWGRLFLPSTAVSPTPQLNYDNHHRSTSYSGSPYGYNVVNSGGSGLGSVPVFYLRSSTAPQQVGLGVGVVQPGGDVPMVYEPVPVVHGKAAAKRLRLFGVNMECPIQEDSECDTTIPHVTTMASLPPHSQASALQLRLYNGSPRPTVPTDQSPNKGKASLSFDMDI